MEIIIVALIVGVLTFLAGWGASKANQKKILQDDADKISELKIEETYFKGEIEKLKTENAGKDDKIKELEIEKARLEERIENVQQKLNDYEQAANEQILELKSTIKECNDKICELDSTLGESRGEVIALKNEKQNNEKMEVLIKEQFTNIAHKTIVEYQDKQQEQNVKVLATHLEPFTSQLENFKKQVENYNKNGEVQATTIKEKIETIVKESSAIKMQAEHLTNALKDNSKVKGMLGEIILEKILKLSGLTNKNEDSLKGHYSTQKKCRNLNNSNPNANLICPDVVIDLPDDKHIVIDAKFPYNDFAECVNASSDDEKDKFLKQFYTAVSSQVKELSEKYSNLEGLNTPDFTLMFIPLEACVNYIYSAENIVFESYNKKVIIVGPSSLLTILNLIERVWRQQNDSEEIKNIVKSGQSIYDKCRTLIEKLETVSKSLGAVQNNFDEAFKTIQGQGGLISKIQNFTKLGFSSAKKIAPKYYMATDELEALTDDLQADEELTENMVQTI